VNGKEVWNAVGLVTLHVVITDESACNRAKNSFPESITAKRYGLWQYNSICLQGRKGHIGSERLILSKAAGV